MRKTVLLALTTTLLLGACANRAQVSRDGMSDVSGKNQEKQANALNAGPGEKFDPVEDELISKETLKAWRHALAHDDPQGMVGDKYKEQRRKDEEEAMDMLKKLSEAHPGSSYIKTMMGQVKQHFGKKEEAANYYEEALLQNRRDPILIFKAAEMRRNSGNLPQAQIYYRQVLKLQPDFPGAQVGLARCLMANSGTAADGKKMIDEILAKDPEDKEAKAALADSQKTSAEEKK